MENPFKKIILGAAIGSSLATPETGAAQTLPVDNNSLIETQYRSNITTETATAISFEQAVGEMKKNNPEAYYGFLFSHIDAAEQMVRQGKKERDHDGVQIVVYGEHELLPMAIDNFALGNMVAATHDIQAGLLRGGASVVVRGRDLERITEEKQEVARISGKQEKYREFYSRPDFFVTVHLVQIDETNASQYEAVVFQSDGTVVTTMHIPLSAENQNVTEQQDAMLEAIGEEISAIIQK